MKARYGLPMSDAEFDIFKLRTGRSQRPEGRPETILVLCGRQSRKTLMMACDTIYTGVFETFWRPYVKPGKKVYLVLVACDKVQARQCFDYCNGILHASLVLKKEIRREREWDIELRNGVVIMIRTASFRLIRGPQYIGGRFDEVAFLREGETAANPAAELAKGFLPALIPGGCLYLSSTVYGKNDIAFDMHRKFFGKDDPSVLVWTSDTMSMNPLFDKGKIDRALVEDRAHALAEYYSVFRDDVSQFIPFELIEAATIPGRYELPRIAGADYHAWCDSSSGRQDSATLGIAHKDDKSGRVILDVLRERVPPFQPEGVISEFSDVLKSYGISTVTADRYAVGYVNEAFAKNQITVQNSDLSASEVYLNFLPMISNGSAELLDNKRLRAQLAGLERKTRTGGRDLVDHFPGGHDDLSAACSGACVLAGSEQFVPRIWRVGDSDDKTEGWPWWAKQRF